MKYHEGRLHKDTIALVSVSEDIVILVSCQGKPEKCNIHNIARQVLAYLLDIATGCFAGSNRLGRTHVTNL